ncbi:hypothetical protein, partial [Marinomonas sp.]|uniref:hypothetical protein n=1 Tax=Marinomonas sp. TaxID=1904862 RepID=UPI003F95E9F7
QTLRCLKIIKMCGLPDAYVKSVNSQHLELDYDCRPCNQNITCPYNNKCMNDIPFNELKHSIDETFGIKENI